MLLLLRAFVGFRGIPICNLLIAQYILLLMVGLAILLLMVGEANGQKLEIILEKTRSIALGRD